MESGRRLRPTTGSSTDDLECPLCDSKSIETNLHTDEFKYGSDDSAVSLRVELPVRRCTDCGFDFIDHEGEQLQHEAVCRHLGVLTPIEVRAVRERYGMTRAAFAEATGLGEATLGRWETGAVVQNRANDRYLRLTRFPLVMTLLQRLSSRESQPAPEFSGSDRRFQTLVVDKSVRQRQSRFQLGPGTLQAAAYEVRAVRERYGMTRAAFAEATGLGEATLGRWETGAVVQNRANDRYLRLTRFPLVMTLLQRLSSRESQPAPELSGSDRRFQTLVVDKSVRQRQSRFQLGPGTLQAIG